MTDASDQTPTFILMVLSQDVRNPRPDKRHKYDWTKWEVWTKGDKFEIETMGDVEIIRHVKRGLPGSNSMSVNRHPEQFAALRPHLVKAHGKSAPRRKIAIDEVETLIAEIYGQIAPQDVTVGPDYRAGALDFRDAILARLKKLQ